MTSEKWQLSDQAAGYYETYLYQLDSIPDSPYPDALANALKTHLSLAAGNGLRAPFAKSYQADFQTAVSQAGFTAVHVEAPTLDFRISDLNEYVRGPHGLASIGRRDRSASKRRKTAILSDVRARLGQYENQNGFVVPMASEIVSASKPGQQAIRNAPACCLSFVLLPE